MISNFYASIMLAFLKSLIVKFQILKLYVNFVYVCLKDQKLTQTNTKVTLHPPPTSGKVFPPQMNGMVKYTVFYSSDMAFPC